jgi:hypothetical protein
MLNDGARLIVSDGRGQAQRRPPALSGDYFRPAEMGFEQLLALASEYARAVKFVKLDLLPEGHWQQFFSADETVFMASLLAVDTQAMLRRFDARLLAAPAYGSWFAADARQALDGSYRDRIDSPLLAARSLDLWLAQVVALPGQGGQAVRKLLESILSGLQHEMLILAAAAPAALGGVHTLFGPDFLRLTSWTGNPATAEPDSTSINAELSPGLQGSAVRHNFHTLVQAVRMLQNGIRALLPASLGSGRHDPAISLLIGFVELFQRLQQRLNRFGDKRIDFYFQRVLGMQPHPQTPDSAFLVIRPTAAARQIQIEQGAAFIAGVDADQHNILYGAERAAVLSDARVVALHTLLFQRHDGAGQRVTSGSYARQLDLLPLETDEAAHQKLVPVPLLGQPKPGAALHGGGPARLGFALASRVLLMREGERAVRVLFRYNGRAGQQGNPIEDCLQAIAGEWQENGQADGQGDASSNIHLVDNFIKLFRGMFRLSLTTATGWHAVPEYRPQYHGLDEKVAPDCLSIAFALPAGAPPITGYDPVVHGEGYATVLPVLRFEMTQNEYSYPYDILSRLHLRDIRIEVDVRAVRQLLLYNQIGQLSALSPFMPFGPLPALGSYLIVGCEEILYKQLNDMSLDIEWNALPPGPGGFLGYYRGYDAPLESGAVRASVAVLADGKWVRAGADCRVFRYDTLEDDSPGNLTSSESRISFRPTVQYFKPQAGFADGDGVEGIARFSYSSASMNGLFKLTLEGPSGGFGHHAYPALLARVLTHNARMKKPQLAEPLPNPPYTPQVGRISLNYGAAATIDFEHKPWIPDLRQLDSFIHLHPLGQQTMLLGQSEQAITQIPVYDGAGNLFIGVEGSQLRGTLSLFFYLREDSLPPGDMAECGLSWSYLSGNRWCTFDANQILEDSTKAFMTSGIVLIRLPDQIDLNNTIMPAGKLWLQLSAQRCLAHFCSLYAVYAQAIEVTWQSGQGQRDGAVLPAKRISKSLQNIPGVDSIHQIRRSFDGRAAESAEQFRVRASERLRHKMRAVTAADFELLILEQFPEVYKVKCFPNMVSAQDPALRLRPGHILIVVIPHLNGNGHINQRPTLSGHLLGEIAEYVRRFAAPDAIVTVENPVYELVQVRCKIKLVSQLSSGDSSERINQALCDYLSPWNGTGVRQHFGWTVRQHDIESFLLDLDIVDDVGAVALLQIVPLGPHAHAQPQAQARYAMRDNACHPAGAAIVPSYPWSIAVPMNQHRIELGAFIAHPPQPVGINELRVGSTFIIPPGETP